MYRKAILFVSFLAFMIGAAGNVSAKRVALVIANSEYDHAGKLLNPKNDAQALAEAFRRLNFDSVTLKENLDYRNLRLALKDFASESAGAELALVYFAGHGIEVSGQNYLIPTDARLESATDVDFEGIPLPSVLSSVEGAQKLKLVILDACRNNPFRSRMVGRSSTRSIGRGLAKVEPDNNNTLVAFAAKEGTVALDGDGQHSPYANALLQMVEKPGLEIGFLFRRVRDLVLQTTGQRQEPYTYGSLGGTPIFLKQPEQVADTKESAESEDRIAILRRELDELKRQFNQGKPSAAASGEIVVADAADSKTRENTNSGDSGSKQDATEQNGGSTQDEFSAPDQAENDGKSAPQTVASAEPTAGAQEAKTGTEQNASADGQASSPELVADIQRELSRLGCNPGPADGLWGLRTSSALADLNQETGQSLNTTDPEQASLDAMRKMQAPACKTPPQIANPAPARPAQKATQKKPYNPPKKKEKKEYRGGENTRIDCETGRRITNDCF